MIDDLFAEFDNLVCGVDEAGRGPLAGPVVASAVILGEGVVIEGLNDSKKLSAKKRESLEPIIKERALAWAVAEASVEEIDRLNILQATFLAMKRAVDQIASFNPDIVLVDGNRLPGWGYRSKAIVKGDSLVAEISAASILAKTYRDRLMTELAAKYPEYGFDKHAGYGTAEHIKALFAQGPCPHHRLSFRPVYEAKLFVANKS